MTISPSSYGQTARASSPWSTMTAFSSAAHACCRTARRSSSSTTAGAIRGFGGYGGFFVNLPPPVIRIPRERYIVEDEFADQALLYETMVAPPVETIERPYSLEEIRYSAPLRDRMPRIDLNTVTFESGSWELSPDQVQKLAAIADGLNRAIAQNPQRSVPDRRPYRCDRCGRGQSVTIGPPRGIDRDRADTAIQRAGGEPVDTGLWRAISEGADARPRTREPSRHMCAASRHCSPADRPPARHDNQAY